jgi:hypothetical protein
VSEIVSKCLMTNGVSVPKLTKSELATGSLKGIPLHAVLGGDLTEIGVDDLGSLSRTESARVGTGTVVTLALGGEKSIEALGVGGLAS